MATLPVYVYLVFIITFLTTIIAFSSATLKPRITLILIMIWAITQSVLSLTGFYLQFNAIPPRFPLLIIVPAISILLLFINPKGRNFIDGINIKTLCLMNTIRIPVEVVLYWLALHKAIPWLMTLEGRNFDIISGLSAPLIYYWGFVKNKLNRNVLIVWNILCLGLVINVLVNGVLSIPSPIQQFGFDQPNIAILYFPFVLLPTIIVPIVIFSHLVSIRKLMKIPLKY